MWLRRLQEFLNVLGQSWQLRLFLHAEERRRRAEALKNRKFEGTAQPWSESRQCESERQNTWSNSWRVSGSLLGDIQGSTMGVSFCPTLCSIWKFWDIILALQSAELIRDGGIFQHIFPEFDRLAPLIPTDRVFPPSQIHGHGRE